MWVTPVSTVSGYQALAFSLAANTVAKPCSTRSSHLDQLIPGVYGAVDDGLNNLVRQ